MGSLTLQVHHNDRGWLDAAELNFKTRESIELIYDIDYALEFEQRTDRYALSLQYPIDFQPYNGPVPGFVLDLIPQGEPLKRILTRYGIAQDFQYEEIMKRVPLASPGNIRVKEAWEAIEQQRDDYHYTGFSRAEIVDYQSEFTEYMEKVGAPIGGTSGAGGGSPKCLLREDQQGRFHADGMLDDDKTKSAWLIKFPYTDSQNSVMLSHVEKAYYDMIRELPLMYGDPIDITDDVLFIKRFDRERDKKSGRLLYHGLESFYGAQNVNTHGSFLYHEDNLKLIHQHSTKPTEDIFEYLKRDLLNTLLANPDNHGRNSSFIKKENTIRLSPIYDVTAMKFFKSGPIVPLTRWKEANSDLRQQIQWIVKSLEVSQKEITQSLKEFHDALSDLPQRLEKHGTPKDIIERSAQDRNACLEALKKL